MIAEPFAYSLSASDADEECRFECAPERLAIAPGEAATASVTAQPARPIWIGRPRDRAIRVQVGGDAWRPDGRLALVRACAPAGPVTSRGSTWRPEIARPPVTARIRSGRRPPERRHVRRPH